MTIFDLVFIAVFLATVTTLIVACTGRFKVLLPLAVCLAIYYGAVLLTAHTSGALPRPGDAAGVRDLGGPAHHRVGASR